MAKILVSIFLLLCIVVVPILCHGDGGGGGGDGDDSNKKLGSALRTCAKKYHLSTKDEDELESGKMPSSHNGKCFVGCVLTKLGLLVKGKMTIASCKAFLTNVQLNPENAKDLYERCHNKCENSNNYCKTGPPVYQCYISRR